MGDQHRSRSSKDSEPHSGYTDGKRPMPVEGEDRKESIYRNPVGAQSGMPLEGQQEVETGAQEGGTRPGRGN